MASGSYCISLTGIPIVTCLCKVAADSSWALLTCLARVLVYSLTPYSIAQGKNKGKSDKPTGEKKSRRNNNKGKNSAPKSDQSNGQKTESRNDRSNSDNQKPGRRTNENNKSTENRHENRKKHNNKKKKRSYKSTEASAKLKGKFMWPLEK